MRTEKVAMTKQSLIGMIFHAWIFAFFYQNSTRTPKKDTLKKTPQKTLQNETPVFPC